MKSLHKSTKVIMTAIVLVILVISIITGVKVKSTSEDRKVREKLELGERYLSELKYEEAIIAFKEVIAIEPKNVDAYLGIADAYVALEEPEEASTWLKKGIAVFEGQNKVVDGCEELYIKSSEIYKDGGDLTKAIDVLERGYRFTLFDKILELLESLIGTVPDKDFIIAGNSYGTITVTPTIEPEVTIKPSATPTPKPTATVMPTVLPNISNTDTINQEDEKKVREGEQIVKIINVKDDGKIEISDYFEVNDYNEESENPYYSPNTKSDDLMLLQLSDNVKIVMNMYYYQGALGFEEFVAKYGDYNSEYDPILINELREFIDKNKNNEYYPGIFTIVIENGYVIEIIENYYA